MPQNHGPAPAARGAPAGKPRQLVLEVKPWKGDFDGMLEHRALIRPLLSPPA